MFTNYLTIGWRSIVNNKLYSIINIVGLAFGLAVAMLIGLWIFDELSFNHAFKNYDRLAQVYHHITFGTETMSIGDVPAPIGELLKNNYREFEEVTIVTSQGEHLITFNEKKLFETGLFVEPQFISMFSVDLLQGSDKPLVEIHSILISKKLASTLFDDNPVGKLLKLDNRDLLTVTGIFEDFPTNSQFADVKFFLPMTYYFNISETNRKQQHNWEDYMFDCFVLLNDQAHLADAETKIKKVLHDNASNDAKALQPVGILFPMNQWHLYNEFKDGVNTGGQIRFVWMFGTIGLFVLLLACINFINLSTARSVKRSKEVGVRKVMGSARKQLILQFLVESLLIVLSAYFLGLTMAAVSLPAFNALTGKQIIMPWADYYFILVSIAFIVITGLLAGTYPAFYLSGFNPVSVLKGSYRAGRFAALPRKGLVIMQFTIAIVMIIGTAVVFQQIQHAKDRPVGFDRKGIIHIAIRTEALAKADYNSLRTELMNTGAVENMALSDYPITGSMGANASITWEGKDPALKPLIAMNSCSHDFPRTNGFQFIEGRDFSREYSTDSSAVIVNELAAKLISDESVISKNINFGYGKPREIIGVIRDQVRWTPFVKQSPHIYYVSYTTAGYLTIRLLPQESTQEALQKIEAVIKKFDDGAPFDYKFQDDDYERLFNDEERIGKLAAVFSLLTIFISCIGIFGLATFTSSQRTKEIGIRKVLGASVFALWKMLSTEFIKLVTIAIAFGIPVSYYLSTQWLQQYDYRVEISWVIFSFAGLLTIVITLFTVSYQAIKAAQMNPTMSLKAE